MKINTQINEVQCIKKVYGYSAVELIGVLAVFAFLMLYGNNYLNVKKIIEDYTNKDIESGLIIHKINSKSKISQSRDIF